MGYLCPCLVSCNPEEAVLLDYLTAGVVGDEEAVKRPTIPVEITWVPNKVHLPLCESALVTCFVTEHNC